MSSQHPHPPPNDQPNTVTVTLTNGDTMDLPPNTPVRAEPGVDRAWEVEAGPVQAVFEPMREFWTPYEPWMRDVLADDARMSWITGIGERRHSWSVLSKERSAFLIESDGRVHPDDVPARPAEDDPMALPRAIMTAWHKTDAKDDVELAQIAARAACEHMMGELHDRAEELEWRSMSATARAEKAEAERDEARKVAENRAYVADERDRFAASADHWRGKHAALRADVDGLRRDDGGWPSLTRILDRDAARDPQPDPERDDPTNERLCGPPHCMQREGHFMPCDWDDDSDSPTCDTVTLPREDAGLILTHLSIYRTQEIEDAVNRTREALGWGDGDE